MRTLTTLSILLCSIIGYAQSPPAQPLSGPGSSDYPHADVTVNSYGSGNDEFWIFEPASPTPDSADLVIFNHGFGLTTPSLYGAWMKHLAQRGNIVIWPRYQVDLNTPNTTYVDNAAGAIAVAMDTLALPGHVKPRTEHTAMVGHSLGGMITADLTIEAAQRGLPQPRATMFAQAALAQGAGRDTYEPFPADTRMLIVVGDDDIIVDESFGRRLMDSAAVDPMYKNFVRHYADNYGSPAITAAHEDPVAIDDTYDNGASNLLVFGSALVAKIDATDWYCYWKLFDALIECTFYEMNCITAFGDTDEQRFMGEWSDGTAVVELEVEAPSSTDIASDLAAMGLEMRLWEEADELAVRVEADKAMALRLEIRDMQGRLMQADKWQVAALDVSEHRYSVASWAKGAYILSVIAADGSRASQTIIRR